MKRVTTLTSQASETCATEAGGTACLANDPEENRRARVNTIMLPDLVAVIREANRDDLPLLCGRLREAEALATQRLATPVVPASDTERLLDMIEVARLLGVPPDRAYDLGRQRALPVVTVGKYKRVRLSAVMAFIAANEKVELDSAAHPRKARGR